MKRALVTAALALPLAGLAGNIALNEIRLTDATVWEIPVSGYDPRDILRGNYIEFQYDWQVSGDPAPCDGGDCQLCFMDAPPDGSRVEIRAAGMKCEHAVDPDASALHLRRIRSRAAEPGSSAQDATMTATGRYFVPETAAPGLEASLRDGPMAMRARLTCAGRLMNEELIPITETDR